MKSDVNYANRPRVCLAVVMTVAFCSSIWSGAGIAQNAGSEPFRTVDAAEDWVRYKTAQYRGRPILLHLRTGYQRPIILPEPVQLADPAALPPDCTIDVDVEVVVFSPASHFGRQSIELVGEETGTRYVLRVRSSENGKRIPIQILNE